MFVPFTAVILKNCGAWCTWQDCAIWSYEIWFITLTWDPVSMRAFTSNPKIFIISFGQVPVARFKKWVLFPFKSTVWLLTADDWHFSLYSLLEWLLGMLLLWESETLLLGESILLGTLLLGILMLKTGVLLMLLISPLLLISWLLAGILFVRTHVCVVAWLTTTVTSLLFWTSVC